MDSWSPGKAFSFFVVITSALIAAFLSPALFLLTLVPLMLLFSSFREWNLLRHWGEIKKRGEFFTDAKFRKERRNAEIGMAILVTTVVFPAVLTFLPAPQWLSATLGVVMAWPASNLLILAISRASSGGKPLYKVYVLNLIGEKCW